MAYSARMLWHVEGAEGVYPTFGLCYWLTSVFVLAVQYGKLHYRNLEFLKKGQIITKCGGRWACHKAESRINFLELKAILLALQSCESLLATSRTVCIHSDNMTAISY